MLRRRKPSKTHPPTLPSFPRPGKPTLGGCWWNYRTNGILIRNCQLPCNRSLSNKPHMKRFGLLHVILRFPWFPWCGSTWEHTGHLTLSQGWRIYVGGSDGVSNKNTPPPHQLLVIDCTRTHAIQTHAIHTHTHTHTHTIPFSLRHESS